MYLWCSTNFHTQFVTALWVLLWENCELSAQFYIFASNFSCHVTGLLPIKKFKIECANFWPKQLFPFAYNAPLKCWGTVMKRFNAGNITFRHVIALAACFSYWVCNSGVAGPRWKQWLHKTFEALSWATAPRFLLGFLLKGDILRAEAALHEATQERIKLFWKPLGFYSPGAILSLLCELACAIDAWC